MNVCYRPADWKTRLFTPEQAAHLSEREVEYVFDGVQRLRMTDCVTVPMVEYRTVTYTLRTWRDEGGQLWCRYEEEK